MRRRSPSYSPPRRGYRSPPRGRFGRHRDSPCGLLVRNIPKDSRPEEVRAQFERYGRIRDVYLPKDFHTGEPRGFGFVQFLDPYDAAEAKAQMDRQVFKGREISVVFAEENRKRPEEMRSKERSSFWMIPCSRTRMSYGGYRRSPYRPPYRGRSMSRSPHSRSPSPRNSHHFRSYRTSSRRRRHESYSPSPYSSRSWSVSPDGRRQRHESFSDDRSRSWSPKNGKASASSHRKGATCSRSPARSRSSSPKYERPSLGSHRKGRNSESPARSSSLYSNRQVKSLSNDRQDSRSRSHSNELERFSKSSQKPSKSRSKSRRESRSPHSCSPCHRKDSLSPHHGLSRDTPDPAKKSSSLLSEIRSERQQSEERLQ